MDSAAITIGVIIPSDCAGRVIGKGGAGLKQLREQCQCSVDLKQEAETQLEGFRRADLSGPGPDQVGRAFQLLAGKIFGDKPTGECSLSFMIPDSYVGAVIGKGGDNLKRIRNESNVRFTVEKEHRKNPLSGAQERAAILVADHVRQFGQAVAAALSQVLGGPRSGGSHPPMMGAPPPAPYGHHGHQGYQPPQGHQGYQPPHSMAPPSQAAPPVVTQVKSTSGTGDEVQIHMCIPGKYIGAILGKEGSQIKQITAQTGCRSVSVTKREQNINDRRVVVVGGFDQCIAAERAVYNHYVTAANQDQQQVDDITVLYMVPKSQAGAVIGKEAGSLKRIRETSNAKVNLERQEVEGFRVCNIAGDLENVILAQRMVCEQVEIGMGEFAGDPSGGAGGASKRSYSGFQDSLSAAPEAKRARTGPSNPDGTGMTKLLVPGRSAGAVIGKAGANLKMIRESTGVHLELLHQDKAPQWPNDRVVILKGTSSTRRAGFSSVMHSAFSQDDNPNASICLKMLVNGTEAGAIIGKGGANLKAIREQSNCKVQVERDQIEGERLVSIDGPYNAVVSAANSIMDSLDDHSAGGRTGEGVSQLAGVAPPPPGAYSGGW
eukprot:TRINITY_DN64856_c0_g1_i1.p1 TRINITY_DN64856_c0_g1~~TRINITY_DN64856_c0_g1_i1.p1  ORF type:complete len:604 (+),score=96.21 TRINITY_DN64856_c0_g1_i1:118-1929(+)